MSRSPFFLQFERGCAEMYDARHEDALRHPAQVPRCSRSCIPLWQWHSGGSAQGCALGALRTISRAWNRYSTPRRDMPSIATHILHFAARLLVCANLSDWGKPHDMNWLLRGKAVAAVPADVGTPLEVLFHAVASSTLARSFLRSGERNRGLAVLEEVAARPEFPTLAAVPRGSILRMRGILLAMSSETAAARADLEDAIGIFRTVGYLQGEVQAAAQSRPYDGAHGPSANVGLPGACQGSRRGHRPAGRPREVAKCRWSEPTCTHAWATSSSLLASSPMRLRITVAILKS